MGRPIGPPTKTVTVVLSRPAYDQIHQQAKARETTTSSHIRNILETMFPGNEPSPLAILPTDDTQPADEGK